MPHTLMHHNDISLVNGPPKLYTVIVSNPTTPPTIIMTSVPKAAPYLTTKYEEAVERTEQAASMFPQYQYEVKELSAPVEEVPVPEEYPPTFSFSFPAPEEEPLDPTPPAP